MIEMASHADPQGVWTSPASPDTIVREHGLDHRYQYRVRASDCAGNRSPWKTTKPRAATADDAQPGSIAYTPDWAQLSEPGHFEATLTGSRKAGARATYATSARRIAWIAPRGPDGGTARVSVDGVAVATVDLSATSPRPRRVVWQKTWTSAADHTIQIEILSGRIDIDAFAVLR
jgi:hypothetical protein